MKFSDLGDGIKRAASRTVILFATIIWGTSFIVLKDAITELPPIFVIATRFLVAGGLLFIIAFKKIVRINLKTFLHGALLGVFLAAAYALQTVGLAYTTPSKNAFLTAIYVVFCPFLLRVLFKKRIKAYNVAAAVLALIGLGLVAYGGAGTSSAAERLGDGLTISSGVFFALQIIFNARFAEDEDARIPVLTTEILTAGVLLGCITLAAELPVYGADAYALDTDVLLRLTYLATACTLFTQWAQLFGQRYVPPEETSVILSLEAVFGTLFSVALGYERLTPYLIVGFSIIFFAILVNEVTDPLIRKIKSKNKTLHKKN